MGQLPRTGTGNCRLAGEGEGEGEMAIHGLFGLVGLLLTALLCYSRFRWDKMASGTRKTMYYTVCDMKVSNLSFLMAFSSCSSL